MDRIGRDRRTARQRFDHDQAERVGPAGEDENVGRCIGRCERRALQRAEKVRARMPLCQIGSGRSVPDDDLRSFHRRVQEGADILLDRHAAYAEHGPRDGKDFPRDRIPVMVWQANLWGRSVLNLVLKNQLREAYDILDEVVHPEGLGGGALGGGDVRLELHRIRAAARRLVDERMRQAQAAVVRQPHLGDDQAASVLKQAHGVTPRS